MKIDVLFFAYKGSMINLLSSAFELMAALAWTVYTDGRCEFAMRVLNRFSRVQLFATPWTVACQVPLSMGFSK